jgi:hypothetical protein
MMRGWGQGGEMTQALYAHVNNKRKKKRPNEVCSAGENNESLRARFARGIPR